MAVVSVVSIILLGGCQQAGSVAALKQQLDEVNSQLTKVNAEMAKLNTKVNQLEKTIEDLKTNNPELFKEEVKEKPAEETKKEESKSTTETKPSGGKVRRKK